MNTKSNNKTKIWCVRYNNAKRMFATISDDGYFCIYTHLPEFFVWKNTEKQNFNQTNLITKWLFGLFFFCWMTFILECFNYFNSCIVWSLRPCYLFFFRNKFVGWVTLYFVDFLRQQGYKYLMIYKSYVMIFNTQHAIWGATECAQYLQRSTQQKRYDYQSPSIEVVCVFQPAKHFAQN